MAGPTEGSKLMNQLNDGRIASAPAIIRGWGWASRCWRLTWDQPTHPGEAQGVASRPRRVPNPSYEGRRTEGRRTWSPMRGAAPGPGPRRLRMEHTPARRLLQV